MSSERKLVIEDDTKILSRVHAKMVILMFNMMTINKFCGERLKRVEIIELRQESSSITATMTLKS